MISVIIISYNAERTISRCIESVLNQSFTDFEVVVLNDGSTDNTMSIINEYAKIDSRIKPVTRENRGIAFSRQEALDLSTGEYTIFVDADDWVEPDYLEVLYSCARNKNVDIVICDFWVERRSKREYSCEQPKSLAPEMILGQILSDIHGSLWNKLILREAYARTGVRFLPGLNCCEDQFVIMALLSNNVSVAYVNKALYHYDKTNEDSMTNNWLNYPVERRLYFINNIKPFIITDFQKRCYCDYIGRIAYNAVASPRKSCPNYKSIFKPLWPQIVQSTLPKHKKWICYLRMNGIVIPIRLVKLTRKYLHKLIYGSTTF